MHTHDGHWFQQPKDKESKPKDTESKLNDKESNFIEKLIKTKMLSGQCAQVQMFSKDTNFHIRYFFPNTAQFQRWNLAQLPSTVLSNKILKTFVRTICIIIKAITEKFEPVQLYPTRTISWNIKRVTNNQKKFSKNRNQKEIEESEKHQGQLNDRQKTTKNIKLTKSKQKSFSNFRIRTSIEDSTRYQGQLKDKQKTMRRKGEELTPTKTQEEKAKADMSCISSPSTSATGSHSSGASSKRQIVSPEGEIQQGLPKQTRSDHLPGTFLMDNAVNELATRYEHMETNESSDHEFASTFDEEFENERSNNIDYQDPDNHKQNAQRFFKSTNNNSCLNDVEVPLDDIELMESGNDKEAGETSHVETGTKRKIFSTQNQEQMEQYKEFMKWKLMKKEMDSHSRDKAGTKGAQGNTERSRQVTAPIEPELRSKINDGVIAPGINDLFFTIRPSRYPDEAINQEAKRIIQSKLTEMLELAEIPLEGLTEFLPKQGVIFVECSTVAAASYVKVIIKNTNWQIMGAISVKCVSADYGHLSSTVDIVTNKNRTFESIKQAAEKKNINVSSWRLLHTIQRVGKAVKTLKVLVDNEFFEQVRGQDITLKITGLEYATTITVSSRDRNTGKRNSQDLLQVTKFFHFKIQTRTLRTSKTPETWQEDSCEKLKHRADKQLPEPMKLSRRTRTINQSRSHRSSHKKVIRNLNFKNNRCGLNLIKKSFYLKLSSSTKRPFTPHSDFSRILYNKSYWKESRSELSLWQRKFCLTIINWINITNFEIKNLLKSWFTLSSNKTLNSKSTEDKLVSFQTQNKPKAQSQYYKRKKFKKVYTKIMNILNKKNAIIKGNKLLHLIFICRNKDYG